MGTLFLVQPAMASTDSEALENSTDSVTNEMADAQTELGELVQSCNVSVDACITQMVNDMEQMDEALVYAESQVAYVLFAGPQEKRVLRLALHTSSSKTRVEIEALEDIQARLNAGTITEEEAKTEVEGRISDFRTYLSENKDNFKNKVLEFMKLKVKASKVYTGWGIEFAGLSEDNYQTLGYTTTGVENTLAKASTHYNEAVELYASAKDGDDEGDIADMRQAAFHLVRARQNLSHAAVTLKTFETDWSDDRD